MASQSEDDLSCPICHEVFKDPLFLSCSHSFCKDCLRSWWREKPTQDCPVCKRRSSKSDPPRNLALRNLCEAYVQQREKKEEEQLCQVHSEKLKLFCLSDQQPVCVVCRDSKVHEDHRFRPIAEAAQDLREQLDKSMLPLKENLQKAKDLRKEILEKAGCITKDFNQTQRQIQAGFKKLHQFLVEEEESRMAALREEEEQKTRTMKDKMAALSGEIEALSETIRAREEQLRAADVSFLLKYKAAVERVQCCPLLEEEPHLGPGAVIDQAKHLGNLTFNIWTNMKRLVHFTPVILDTKRIINAVLSDDLTSFTQNEAAKSWSRALGSEGYTSGSHSWVVEVKNSNKWEIGVMTNDDEDDDDDEEDDDDDDEYSDEEEDDEDDDEDEDDNEEDYDDYNDQEEGDESFQDWCISFSNGKYAAEWEDYRESLKLESSPRRIEVNLDCDKQKVSFYDADTKTHIHTFIINQGKVYPIFWNKSTFPIKVLPKKVKILI